MSLANWGFRNTGVIRPASAPIASQHAQYQMETEDNPCNNNDIVLKLTNRENQSVRGNSREVVHNGSTCSEEEQRDHGRCRDASETESSHKDELLNFGVVDLDERFTENEVVVCQQTALVTLVDGIVRASGRRALLYKCAVCALHYTNLDSVRCHLDTHVMSPPFAYREKSVKAPMKIDDDDEVQLHDDAPGIVVKDRTKDADVDVLVLKGSPDASKFGLIQESGSENGLMAVAATTPCLDSRPSAVKIANDVHQDDSGVTSQLQQPHQQPSGDIPSPLQAEDLSKNCQRRLRSLSARRRTIQSLHCRRPTQRLALVTSEMLASDNKESDDPSTEEPVAVEQSVAGGETLANAIRQKEHLGDDVTVVIPSDAPLDVAVRHQGSIRTETPTRAVGVDEAGKHIAHSPVKSIMGHPLVQKKSRISGTGSVSTSAATVPNASDAIQAGVASPDKTSLAVDGTGFTANQMSLINAAAESLQFAGGLPAMFGPLALSTFVNGFGGLVAAASPFLSYYTQMPTGASLASLMAVPGAAGSPIVTSLPSQSTAAVGDSADTKPVVDSSSDSCKDVAGVEMEEVSNGSGGAAGWSQDASLMAGFASSNIKCSSLSRTHSRYEKKTTRLISLDT
jgi:hypothetical protein